MPEAIDLAAVLASIQQPWQPRTVAVLNDYDVRVVRTHGEFTRHSHPETDEVFLVLSGSLTIRLDDAVAPAGFSGEEGTGYVSPPRCPSKRCRGPRRQSRRHAHAASGCDWSRISVPSGR